jgi:NADPH:quinone reductase-like Zn-dependent oxidoreductase
VVLGRAFKWGAAADLPTEVEAHLERPGSLLHLHTRAQALAPCTLEAHGGVVAVAAAGLNFRDVLNVLGRDPTGEVRPLGGEVSGRLLACGADVAHAGPGERVFGLAPGSLRSVLHTDTRWLGRMPRSLSFDEAVTLPVLWVTVAYALREARVRAGQRVLLHSATGGVGLVALEQLRRCGASVHATAGSVAKHATLRRLGVVALSSSRRAEGFAAGAGAQLRGGRVEVVLSALSRDFTPASLGLLGEAGAFLDIGKHGVWSAARAAAAAAAADFVAVAVDDGCRNCPGWNGEPLWMQAQLGRLARQVEAGAVRPPPHATFSFCEGELRAALRLLQAGENVGKVVVRVRCARRTPPPITHAAPFALPSARLSGVLSADEAACLVAGLPTDVACLVELHSAHIAEPTPALVAFVRTRAAPLLVLCSGATRGEAVLILIDAATVVIGVRGARIAAADRHHLPRRLPAATAEDGPDGAYEGSWLDYVGAEAAARAEARRLCTRLASLPSDLLARCHTELPAATVDGALVVMGSLWPRAARRAGPRLVRVWVDEPHGVAIVELHDPRSAAPKL